jgi:endonuclease/exonuclease/phosphatase (EEP) superfamily protein YafD
VLVWNIFKQQRAEWQSVLNNFGKDAHLVLLQEAQTTPELVKFATSNYLAADQVPALVLAAASFRRDDASFRPPHLLLPTARARAYPAAGKSALVTVYPLPDTGC